MSKVSQPQEHDTSHGSSKLHVTVLASEWSTRKGGLSTINRELAIQLAKFSCVKVTFFLPNCSDKDKKAAASHSVSIRKAERQPGYHDELDWLSFPPDDLRIQVVVGHGVKLGHQAQVIRKSHKCKWIQIVHADPEELGIFKCYENPISTGEQKHHDEVELCQMADFVVSIGPKSTEAFCRYLRRYKKDVFEFTPGVLADFSSVQPETLVPVKRKLCRVLLFGRGDAEDFELKGFDIAARSVAVLSDTHLYFVGAPYGKHQEIAKYFVDLGIPANRLKVRGYVDSQESLKGLFCEVDLVLMPSRTEGFALTGLEALSAGLPVLVSKNSGFGEALDSVPHGSIFVIDSEDPRAWTTAIKGIWNRDRKSQLDEVKAVRCFYGERYSWSGQCKHLIEKMFKLVDGTSSKHEITLQKVPARELKWNKDFTEHRHMFQSLQHLKEVSSSPKENDPIQGSSKLQVTILASEWGSSTGELSTINRELAVQLAKFSCVEVTVFLPNCSDKDKKAAASHKVSILTPVIRPSYLDELDWLSFPPDDLRIHVVVGHGVKLGHQAQVIHKSHKCKWVQIVHADPEELGIFKCYESPMLTGEQKHHDEVELCQMADFVVGIGPKLTEAFRSYPRWCKKDVFSFTPGIFADFSSIQPETVVPVIGKQFYVLVFGHADGKDLVLKLIHIAAMSVAPLSNTCLVFMGAHKRKHDVIAKHFLNFGIPANRLKVREYTDNREYLKRLFSEVDLVLMPSRTEGFGLIGLEALSAGLPVLVSKNSGFGEALDSVPRGSLFVIDSEDPSTWRAAIKSIWNRHRKSQLDEVNAVRCFYGERYSWSKQCKHLIENMAKLVDGTSSEIEVTAQAVRARKRKLNEDFTGILCEPEITARRKGARKLKRNKDFTGTSFEPEITAQTVRTRKLTRNVVLTEYRIIRSLHFLKDVSSLPKTRASCLSNVIEYIRQVYQKREGVIFPVPWCEGFSFQIEDVFTRLRIVGKEKTRGIATTREVTNVTSIFTPHESCEQPLIVLIEGEPGMGKTTYSKKLVFDWVSKQCREWDETFPRIDVLLFLRCRGIKSTIWNAIEDQILPDEIKPEEKEMFFQFLKENPSKLLLVLDGLDEADPQKLEMYLKLIQKRQLPGCYIVLTSRYEAGSIVRPYTDTLLEIVGFTRDDAECFIRKYFLHAKHLAENLISKVYHDSDFLFDEELLKNPLNALQLCVVFEDLKGILPTNRTQLYMEIVLFILRRYESKNGLSNRGKDLLLVYKMELMILGETALDCLRKQELYFDDHKGDIKESLLTKFGFLSIQSGGSKRAPCDRYGFFHKSFQEFFSAYFLAFSIIDDVKTCHSVLTDPRYMGELFHVFKFMSGIVAQRSVETAVSIVQSIASIVVNKTHELVSYLRVAHHFIEECKTFCLSTDLYCTFGESLGLVDVVMRPSSFPFTNEVIGTFFKALTFNSTVRNLEFLKWAFRAEATNVLAQTLRVNTSLSSLNLGSNSIGDEGANSLAQALTFNTSLSSLDLCDNSLGEEAANSFAKALRVNTSLSSLDMSSNYIDAEGAKSLAEALGVNTSLVSLNLSANSIGDKGANSLAEALRVNTSLSSLDLSCNYIDDDGASPLAQALKENFSLSSLNLSSNSIFDKAANLLAEALKVNTSLSSLDLSSNDIDAEGAKSLAEALRRNTSLSSLDLSANSIGDKGANSLAEALRVNTSLSSLDLSSNFIDAEGANSLAHALRENTSLSSLGLSSNFIDAEGATLLAQALKGNTSLSCLGLSSNSIGAEGANSLTQALKLNTSLASLDLSCNSIGDEGARSLSEALKVNTSLSSLDLSFNSIGNKGAHSLAGALRENTSLSLDLSLNFISTEGEVSQSTALGLNCGLSILE